jgi:hypothetical protein
MFDPDEDLISHFGRTFLSDPNDDGTFDRAHIEDFDKR